MTTEPASADVSVATAAVREALDVKSGRVELLTAARSLRERRLPVGAAFAFQSMWHLTPVNRVRTETTASHARPAARGHADNPAIQIPNGRVCALTETNDMPVLPRLFAPIHRTAHGQSHDCRDSLFAHAGGNFRFLLCHVCAPCYEEQRNNGNETDSAAIHDPSPIVLLVRSVSSLSLSPLTEQLPCNRLGYPRELAGEPVVCLRRTLEERPA